MLLGLLLALQILVAVALVGVILLQRSEGGALGMGGGPSGFMTARGAGDLLTRTTAILGAIFFVLSMVLTIVTGHSKGGGSVVDRLKVDALNPNSLNQQVQPQPPPPAQPGAPPPGVEVSPTAPPGVQQQAPSVFEAPKPQVNTAPAAQAPAAAAPRAPSTGPAAGPAAGVAAPAPAQPPAR